MGRNVNTVFSLLFGAVIVMSCSAFVGVVVVVVVVVHQLDKPSGYTDMRLLIHMGMELNLQSLRLVHCLVLSRYILIAWCLGVSLCPALAGAQLIYRKENLDVPHS